MNIIETRNLTHRYWRTEAVQDLTLAVPAGSVFALLGPNGAGKSTTIKMLMNLLRPTSGEANVLGVDSRRLGERERAQIGYVSENQQAPLWMTVGQLLNYCRPFYPTWDRTLENKLLQQFDLPVDRKLKHLSRGMLMKATLLSSLAYRPKLLVLDEPFSGLDPLVREELVHGLLEVSALGEWSILISSHDIEEVERLADWIAVIESGRLKFAEATDALLSCFRRVEVTTASPLMNVSAMPASWLEVEENGSVVRFVETRFDRGTTEQACREHFPEAAVQARPMSLREIFVILARAGRKQNKGTFA